MHYRYLRAGLLSGVAFASLASAIPAWAQDGAGSDSATGDIVVTARRTEERLQDVPISITVYNQEQLANRNVVSPSDLATYTPSLSVNQAYGAEKSSFVIRGFTQESNTSPSVGVYFADVVAPRSQAGTTSGNNVGPGSFIDLQNVQVLKGPQGTLFGRNTTGGAVLLVPQKPTDRFEGYVEGSVGNYDMWRVQGVLNLPLADTFKVRIAVDRDKRDGYMINHSGIGPKDYNDTNYFYARLGIVADLTPDLENYTIATYSHSFSHGYATRLIACERDPARRSAAQIRFAQTACDQIDRQNARGDGPLDTEQDITNPLIDDTQWQLINTTTWTASENLKIKNIVSYSEFYEDAYFSLTGGNFFLTSPPLAAGSPLIGSKIQSNIINPAPGQHGSAQSTFTEELQFQGEAADGRLTWQAGGYYESSKPIGFSSALTATQLYCSDVQALQCANPFGSGSISQYAIKIDFENRGLYAQGTYKLTDRLSLTGGFRYTWDKTSSISESTRYTFLAAGGTVRVCYDTFRFKNAAGGPLPVTSAGQCHAEFAIKSDKATWLVDLDYKPTDDILLYAKYSRGYRQGSLNTNVVGYEASDPEKVDAYEIGAKTSFRGAVRGYFNVSAFYNNFTDQQIRAILIAKPSSGLAGAAAVVNAGKSRIQGVEADGSVTLFDSLKIDVGYTYLDTRLKEIVLPVLPADSPYSLISPTAVAGGDLALSPKNRATVTATYTLPLDESIGRISLGGTFTHTDSQVFTQTTLPQFVRLPATDLVNLNANWNRVLGSPVDVAFFVTNLTNEKYPVSIGGNYTANGFETAIYGQPRMWGFRLRYNFGG